MGLHLQLLHAMSYRYSTRIVDVLNDREDYGKKYIALFEVVERDKETKLLVIAMQNIWFQSMFLV